MTRSATVIGLLFPGAMGAAVGAAARAGGSRVLWSSEERSAATVSRAERAGLEDVETLEQLVAASEIVLSVCPPALAEEVSQSVADAGFTGLYVDANAIAPARARRIARIQAAAGAHCVDGGIIGGPPWKAGTTRLWLSGEHADSVAALFEGTPLEAVALEGAVGTASALKLAYAAFNKISAALAAQSWALARAYGVADQLEREAADTPGSRLANPAWLGSAAAKAWRWTGEMEEIGDACAEIGLPDSIARGAAELFERWDAHRDDGAVPLDVLLADLRRS